MPDTEKCAECGHDADHHKNRPQTDERVCLDEGCRCDRFVAAGELLEEG